MIGSADEWNNQLDRIALLRERYHTAVEDMESAAAAQLCLSYGVPFLGVRILSNSIVNGEKFDEAVGIDGQKFMLSLIDQMREYMNTANIRQYFLLTKKCAILPTQKNEYLYTKTRRKRP